MGAGRAGGFATLVVCPRFKKIFDRGTRQPLARISDFVDLRENLAGLNFGQDIGARCLFEFLRKIVSLATVRLLGRALQLAAARNVDATVPISRIWMSMNGCQT